MNESTALKVARKAAKRLARYYASGKLMEHGYAPDYVRRHYQTYMEAYNTLTAMQMGLDSETDEKTEGWREQDTTGNYEESYDKARRWKEESETAK